ncbi:MAG: amino acid ABC transporter substrate-binding protein, partial [Clostridia bacterium]|nr:amino acid ABC transporter substrate-binding protein [Clostridia bacterium]
TFDDCKSTEDVVEILRKMNKNTKIGYQKDTVSASYVDGDAEWGFTGYNVTSLGYESALQAVRALIDGEVDYVIVDEGPAKMIVEQLNR